MEAGTKLAASVLLYTSFTSSAFILGLAGICTDGGRERRSHIELAVGSKHLVIHSSRVGFLARWTLHTHTHTHTHTPPTPTAVTGDDL